MVDKTSARSLICELVLNIVRRGGKRSAVGKGGGCIAYTTRSSVPLIMNAAVLVICIRHWPFKTKRDLLLGTLEVVQKASKQL